MIEFEHSLFKILLLIAVLNAKPPKQQWALFIIASGLLLAFLPPAFEVPIPWNLILGLTIPLLLWQNARRIIIARWSGIGRDFIAWLGTAILFSIVLIAFNDLGLPGAILFGLVTASIIWRSGERGRVSSVVSQIGPLTLIFLLAEVEPMIESPTRYIGGIFSGIFIGAVIAAFFVYTSLKAAPKIKNWIAIGQIYLAYGVALLLGVSAVAASLVSVIVYVTLGLYLGLWSLNRVSPMPLNTWPGFLLMLVLFLLLGWEAHYPPSNLILLEIAAVVLMSLVIAWVGLKSRIESFCREGSIWKSGFRVSLLLFPALLIWPRDTLQEPVLLIYAFGIAIVNLALSRLTLNYFFE